MHHFALSGGALNAEAVPLTTIAAAVGTPAYVYSAATLRRHARALTDALAGHEATLGRPLIAFAVKAASNVSILRVLAGCGLGADTVSEGEIRRALAAGVPAGRIVFSGVGKTDAELAFAVGLGLRQINVESTVEMERLAAVAAREERLPDVAIRVNPKIGAGGHAKITTGGAGDKFGVPVEEALTLYRRFGRDPRLNLVGLACHIGSQITELTPLRGAFGVLAAMTRTLREEGLTVPRLDLGGGLGVAYAGSDPTAPLADYAALVAETVGGLGVEVTLEPGRLIAANAGVLLSRVIQITERGDGRRILVLDAAMNDLLRPALYDAFHDLVPVAPREGEARAHDVVGPVCETGDTFARDRPLPPLQAGDLVAFTGAGAYGATMASEYNSRPLVPEVLVDGDRWAVVRRRPTYDEMLTREPVADWL
ncbi:MAG: diaminopimelate decarboxylase [Alphaproteobacteria bacterium]|nr:diaminopimelate decarboxylase [Alphaproteobacteria bacterium]MBU1527527.1 diaminopimelate decarboxylase [Alphaproteobacteria bacterium]MBU2116793.1 diaminopimelate decarboxylase [Alphaproteobacteria bacterium]MBU2351503.1 diaminopimelate decarboxylase [Alphaproteobacteria bacterium]MBU2383679.1 diaminopimelate decarboxylase [Alphaproteobacteria bacterium]